MNINKKYFYLQCFQRESNLWKNWTLYINNLTSICSCSSFPKGQFAHIIIISARVNIDIDVNNEKGSDETVLGSEELSAKGIKASFISGTNTR